MTIDDATSILCFAAFLSLTLLKLLNIQTLNLALHSILPHQGMGHKVVRDVMVLSQLKIHFLMDKGDFWLKHEPASNLLTFRNFDHVTIKN